MIQCMIDFERASALLLFCLKSVETGLHGYTKQDNVGMVLRV